MATQTVQVTVPDSSIPAPKSGVQTTEHLLTWVTVGASILGTVTNTLPPATAAVVTSVVVSAYALSRAIVKAAHAAGYAKNVPDLPEVPASGAPK